MIQMNRQSEMSLAEVRGLMCCPPQNHHTTSAPEQIPGALWPNILDAFAVTLTPSSTLTWPQATEGRRRKLTGAGVFERHECNPWSGGGPARPPVQLRLLTCRDTNRQMMRAPTQYPPTDFAGWALMSPGLSASEERMVTLIASAHSG